MPAGPPPAVLGSIVLAGLLVQAQDQVGLGAHHRLFKSLIKSLLHRLAGEKAKQLLGGVYSMLFMCDYPRAVENLGYLSYTFIRICKAR